MNPFLDNEIREKLANYLVGKISLEEFEDWFVSASWNVDQSKNQLAINMVYEIELWLSEYSDDFRSEDELKELLRPLVENYEIKSEVDLGLQFASTAQQNWWSISPVSFDILHSKIS
jgi:hypothetical protein